MLTCKNGQRNVQTSVMYVQSCCFAFKTYCFFLRPRCRPRRWILKSLMSTDERRYKRRLTNFQLQNFQLYSKSLSASGNLGFEGKKINCFPRDQSLGDFILNNENN